MIKNLLYRAIFLLQYFILYVSYCSYKIRFIGRKPDGIVVGMEEVASLLHNINRALPGSKSVNVVSHPYYSYTYDYDLSLFSRFNFIVTPLLLGKLANIYKTFMYIGPRGYLVGHVDGRACEFKFLKSVGCRVVCYFTGSEIRSFDRLGEYGKKHNLDVLTTYQPISHPDIDLPYYENRRRQLAEAADSYADYIFSPSVDQMSYFKRETLPAIYFAPDEGIKCRSKKWCDVDRLVVAHAPSSPIIKATPIVRAAVKKLQEEGYDFEYVELIGVSNALVLQELERAHIVLNQFYAFVPGMFGIEAMAANAVLLTSSDANREPSLFEGANQAWVVTPYWLVYDNLKEQLEASVLDLQKQADRGTDWVKRYCSYSSSSAYLKKIIMNEDD